MIDSYKVNGYKENSEIVVNRNFHLLDGTHRLALNLYNNIDYINVRVLKRKTKRETSLDWYYKKGMDIEKITKVLDKHRQIVDSYEMHNFVAAIPQEAVQYFDKILNDLKILCNVTGHKDVIDDGVCTKKLIFINFDNPLFTIQRNGMPYSQKAKEIEELINVRYGAITKTNLLFCRISSSITEAKQWMDSISKH